MKETKYRILRNYTSPSGATPFVDWINSLKDPVTSHRIGTRLDRVEIGNLGEVRDVIVILLCGGDKSSQVKDIKTAKIYPRYFKMLGFRRKKQ